MIDLDTAKLIGEGEWVKDSAYQYYEKDGRVYRAVVVGQMNREIMDDMTEDVTEQADITLMSWEDKLQWVMRYTDVEMENLFITERAAHPSTPSKRLQIDGSNFYFN